jgi:hypothetical protein
MEGLTDLPICPETGDDVDDCPCVDVLGYDERDAADEQQQFELDERGRED